uniref:DUF4477 domain-containing protein n=1 Tax=Trichuris muris TaxID=70415 RepID=A0A5S6Q4Q3_TRIMR
MDEEEEVDYLTLIERLIQEPQTSLSLQYEVSEHTPLDLTGLQAALSRLISCQASWRSDPFKGVEFYIIEKLTVRLSNTLRHFKLFQLVKRLKRTMHKAVRVGLAKIEDVARFHAAIASKEDGTLHFPSLEMWRRILAETVAHAVCLAHVVDDCVEVGWFSCQTIALNHFVRLCCLLLACSAVLFRRALNTLRQVDSQYKTITAWRYVQLKCSQADQPVHVHWPRELSEIAVVNRALQRSLTSQHASWTNEVVSQLKVITSSAEEFVESALLSIVDSSTPKFSSNNNAWRSWAYPYHIIRARAVPPSTANCDESLAV